MGNSPSHDERASGTTPSDASASTPQATDAAPRSHESDEPVVAHYDGPAIGVAVLGTGFRARDLVRKLAILSRDRVKIKLFLYDEAAPALEVTEKQLAGWWSEEDGTLETADSLQAAVSHPQVQWVMVTSKNYLHKDYCVAALNAGKHVFCEKPLATTIADCLAIKEAAFESGKLFMTGFTLRYSPFYRKIQSLVREGFFGKIVTMEANEMLSADHGGFIFRNWRRFKDQSGPHIMEKCAHDIDILNWMAGSVVTRVAAFGGTDIFTAENKPVADRLQQDSPLYCPLYMSWPAWEDIDPFTCEKTVEDNVVAVLQYRNGIRATFQTNCSSAIPQRQLKIFGLEGTLDSDSIQGRLFAKRMARGGREVEANVHGGQHAGGDEVLVTELLNAMVHTARQGGPTTEAEEEVAFNVSSSLSECFVSTITCLAIDEARESGQVVDVEKYWKELGI